MTSTEQLLGGLLLGALLVAVAVIEILAWRARRKQRRDATDHWDEDWDD